MRGKKHVRVFLNCEYWEIVRIFVSQSNKKGNSCPRSNVKICW